GRAGAGPWRTHAHDLLRHPLCGARPAAHAGVHARRDRDAGARHRRQHRHFSVVHAVALPPMPNRDPSRLLRIWEKNDSLQIPQFSASIPNYMSWRERARSFAELAAWRNDSVTITTGGEPQQLQRLEATATLFPLLDLQPLTGRTFTADEDRPGGPRVVLVAESVWRTRFGARDDMTGATIVLDSVPHTVIGIVRDRDMVVPFD